MNPIFERISIFTWMHILNSNEKCLSFLEGLELIPKQTDPAPECPKCSGPMTIFYKKSYIIGWSWICKKRFNKQTPCSAIINALRGTLFENTHMPLKDILALMFGYLIKMRHNDIKEHMICWRRCRSEARKITDVTIGDFYSRFDDIILFALNQEGKASKVKDYISREKLIRKYAKQKNIRATFQNLLYQFLMDVKSKYPCIKVCKKEDKSGLISETSSTNGNTPVVNETSYEAASTSTDPPCSVFVSSNSSSVKTVSCKNVSLLDCSNTSTSAEDNFNGNKHNPEIDNVTSNTSVSIHSSTPDITFSNDNATCNSPSTCIISDNITFQDNMKNVEPVGDTPASINVQTSKLSNCPSIANVEEIAFGEKENKLEVENVMDFNAQTSSNISFTGNISLNEDCISNYPTMYHIDEEFMEIDHIETVITIDDQHIDNDSL